MGKKLLMALPLIGLFLCSCGAKEKTIPVESVSLDKTELALQIGSKEKLTATVNPSDASNKGISWSSSNADIALVSGGTVYGLSSGEAIITVTTTDGSKTATCSVNVKEYTPEEVHATGVVLNTNNISLDVSGFAILTAIVLPSDAVNKEVTWSSSKEEVVTVDSSGKLTPAADGKAVITATTVDGGFTAHCAVTITSQAPIIHVSSVSVSPDSLNLSVGSIGYLSVSVLPSNADDKSVVWSSSDSSIVSVSSSGQVSGLKVGSATITATSNDGGLTGSCVVSVIEQAKYQVSLDGGITKQELVMNAAGTEGSLTNISAAAGSEIQFSLGDSILTVAPETGERNNAQLDGSKITLKNAISAQEGKGIYLKISGSTYTVWCDGNALRSIVINDSYYDLDEKTESSPSEFYALGITINAGDTVKGAYGHGTAYSLSLNTYSISECFEVSGEDITCKTGGTYDLYLQSNDGGYNYSTVYIGAHA